ncbi:MAG: hypothetical protein ACE5DX_05575, partial [Candidatus Dojkabacteria bacterium]
LVIVDDPFREHDGTGYSRVVLKITFIMALAIASPDAIRGAFKQAQVNEPYAIERTIWMQRLAPDGVGIKVVTPEAIAEIYKDYRIGSPLLSVLIHAASVFQDTSVSS